MKKHNLKKNITRILACALLIATLGLSLASCAAGDKVKDAAGKVWDTAKDGAEKIYDAVKDKITAEQTEGFGEIALLSLATGTEVVDEQDVMYQVIKATVLPESATDQSTTWEVYWIDNQTGDEDANVTDYVTVMACTGEQPYTVQSGSNYCKVTCKQPFTGSTIGVRVTTVVGGFTAECKVTYEGVPTYLGFHEILAGGGYRFVNDQPLLETGSETSYKLVLDNVFHQIGDGFGSYEIQSVEMVNGVIKANQINYTQTGTYVNATNDRYDISDLVDSFVSASIEGDVLTVTAKKVIESYIGNYQGGSSSGSYWQFVDYADSGKPYFAVTVKDTVSGVSNTLRFSILDVSSVSLSDSTLTF